MALLEIACFDAESALIAWKAGADRIELCQDKDAGGTTPSLATVELVKQHVAIPVFVMIRPRGGNFVYSSNEFERMKADMDLFRPLADGFVFGLLRSDGEVETEKTSALVDRAGGLPCTFHRAFDETRDLARALEDVIETGCQAVLTSGGHPNAEAGSIVLAQLVSQAGQRIQVITGGGVREKNICKIQEISRAAAFHSSGMPPGASVADLHEIRQMRDLLR